MKKISIIVPCYNEEENISIFYNELNNTFKKINAKYEIIFIDDGSKDRTLSKIKKIKNNVKYISFSRNFGKEAAIYAGLNMASGDYITIMDVDFQDPPFLLNEMFKYLDEENYDLVRTKRKTRKGEPIIRTFFAKMFYRLFNKICKVELKSGTRDFLLMKKEVLESILNMKEYNRFFKGICSFVGYKTKWIEYDNIERKNGKTKWSFFNLLTYAIEGITSFSTIPLTISFIVGIALVLLSLICFIIIIVLNKDFIYHLAWILFFNTGIILITCGIHGEYLSKVYLEIKERPIYIIKETNIKEKIHD